MRHYKAIVKRADGSVIETGSTPAKFLNEYYEVVAKAVAKHTGITYFGVFETTKEECKKNVTEGLFKDTFNVEAQPPEFFAAWTRCKGDKKEKLLTAGVVDCFRDFLEALHPTAMNLRNLVSLRVEKINKVQYYILLDTMTEPETHVYTFEDER